MSRTTRFGALVVILAGLAIACAGPVDIPGVSVPVDGMQTGYANGCNGVPFVTAPPGSQSSLAFVVIVSHPVYFTFTVNGAPGGEGWTVDGSQFEGFNPGQNLAVTPNYGSGTCVSMTLFDQRHLGAFTFQPLWNNFCIAEPC